MEPEIYFEDETNIVIDADTLKDRNDGREYHIPRNSRFAIFTLPDEHLVRKDRASKAIRLSLDPGWYRIKVVKSLNNRRDREYAKAVTAANFGFDFVCGMTPRIWKRVRLMQPQMRETVMTTDGSRPEHRCAHPNCEEVFVHQAALVIHEYEDHFHKDLGKVTAEELDDLGVD